MLRGSPEHTREAALGSVAGLDPSRVLWVGEPDEQDRIPALPPGRVTTMLGRSFDAVVLDGHPGIDADALGAAHGLVWGGGLFVLRRAAPGTVPPRASQARLAAFPHDPDEVGARFEAWVERALARAELAAPGTRPAPVSAVVGTDEQAAVVERLARIWGGPGPSRVALLADRGRGKSSALGLALAAGQGEATSAALRVAVTAASPEAVAEVLRFARGDGGPPASPPRFVPLGELVFGDERFDLVIVDEAAQLPVPMLRRLVERHAQAHVAMATTTHGYEGTGRGFVLRLLQWLERGPVPVRRLGLRQPIRWDEGDPLERLVFDALLLDAEPAQLPADEPIRDDELVAARVDRDALLHDEPTLRALFGLLVHAHYRTTPGDLHRLLDAPNLAVHVLRWRGAVVAATVVAREGGLPPARCDAMRRGAERIRAHALADALVSHLGHAEAGELMMIRSVRIATHPALRRRGLARRLVEHLHREHRPDLFGTMFGVTPELLAFRRSLGYALVRLSASRGARSGEPSAMMLRPVSPRARALVDRLRAELARDLPTQLQLLRADEQTLLDPALVHALGEGLFAPAPMSADERRALVESYALGPRTFESAAVAVIAFVEDQRARLGALPDPERALVEGRVRAGRGWSRVAREAGLGVPAAMRGLRRAIRRLLEDG
ncbi:MAG: tRNA(Met) cytidine acetyltransferase [Myxococcales bacterium]|nr:tRNA(Met) cytidine acetyltransferase [Myxococcales bacterium]